MTTLSIAARRRRTGSYLLLVFYLCWITGTLSIQFYQAIAVYGYGSGFGDGGHVPHQIAVSAGMGNVAKPDPAAVVKALTIKGPGGGVVKDTVRIVFSLSVLIGIVFFWYSVMSRIGTF